MTSNRQGLTLGLFIVVAVNAILIVLFYNKGWIPADDGHYVHVADRMARGETLSADIEELHPGYVHFIHTWSLQLFGGDLVSLRYPLMAMMTIQSIVVFFGFRRAGWTVATIAAVTMSAIGTLQIANPTTSLYALAMTAGLAIYLTTTTPQTRHRALVIGLFLGAVFLFRQLTAVFVVMGTFAFLFTERQTTVSTSLPARSRLAQAILILSAIGLVGYLIRSTEVGGVLLLGLMPLAVLVWAATHTTISSANVAAHLSRIAAGAAIAASPIVAYHLWHKSLGAWLRDTFLRSLSIGDLDHISRGRFLDDVAIRATRNLLTGSMVERLNAFYWLILIWIAFAVGVGLLRRLMRLNTDTDTDTDTESPGISSDYALPMMAVFYALVSVFNQIPFYLYLSAGMSLIGGLWMWKVLAAPIAPDAPAYRKLRLSAVIAVIMAIVGTSFHAGQPYSRTYNEFVAGERAEMVESALPKFGLWINPAQETQYLELLDSIATNAPADGLLLTIPNNADLYFLTGLQNKFRLFNPTISLLNDEELDSFVEEFETIAPSLIVHDTASQYNTEMTVELLNRITSEFELVDTIDQFEIYVRR